MHVRHPEPNLVVSDMVVRRGSTGDEPAIVAYLERNREHHARSSPTRLAEFYTVPYWQRALVDDEKGFLADRCMHCFLFHESSSEVVGVVNLSNFVRGAFHACHLGYAIDKRWEGRGRMSCAVDGVVQFAFHSLGMHRVMANYLPDNTRSARLLERLSFSREGVAREYLLIDGAWRDHVLTSKINTSWQP